MLTTNRLELLLFALERCHVSACKADYIGYYVSSNIYCNQTAQVAVLHKEPKQLVMFMTVGVESILSWVD